MATRLPRGWYFVSLPEVSFGGIPRNDLRGDQQLTDGEAGHDTAGTVGLSTALNQTSGTLNSRVRSQ